LGTGLTSTSAALLTQVTQGTRTTLPQTGGVSRDVTALTAAIWLVGATALLVRHLADDRLKRSA
jgi:hypothetical protein